MSHRCRQGLLVMVAVSLLVADGWAGSRYRTPGEGRKLSTVGESETGDTSLAPDQSPFQQARELAQAGKYQEALPLAEKALNICEKRWGPNDTKTAGALQLLANIHMGLMQRRKAIPLYQRALAIREKALGPEATETAGTMARLRKAYIEVGVYAQALPLLERSLEILLDQTVNDLRDTALRYLELLGDPLGGKIPFTAKELETAELRLRNPVLVGEEGGSLFTALEDLGHEVLEPPRLVGEEHIENGSGIFIHSMN